MANCLYCGGDLGRKVDLGEMYPSYFFSDFSIYSKVEHRPLTVGKCMNCGLVQLEERENLDTMYREYWYQSGLNPSMKSDLWDVYESIRVYKDLPENILDIGCNDGTLLSFAQKIFGSQVKTTGFDPALNLKEVAQANCNTFINEYFSRELLPADAKFDIITAIAMLYDLPDLDKFLTDVVNSLNKDGIFVAQYTDLPSTTLTNAFDNFCFEHYSYYTLEWIHEVFTKNGLQIFDVEYNSVNGRSIRIYASSEKSKIFPVRIRVKRTLEEEKWLLERFKLEDLPRRVQRTKDIVLEYLKGKSVLGVGASTKGNTLLQVFGLTYKDIPYIAEVNTDKFGLRTLGSDILIIPETDAKNLNPDVFLVLPWHFEAMLVPKFDAYLEKGGTLLFPMPSPHTVTKEYGRFIWRSIGNL